MSRPCPRMPLRQDAAGVAMIEFALVLPVLILLALGGLELWNFGMANLRISQIAMTTADNAARVRNQISEADINELMTGAKFIGRNIKFADNGRIILSSLEPNKLTDTRKGYKIGWQRCAGKMTVVSAYGVEGKGATDNSLQYGMGPSLINANKIKPADDTAVMYVEVNYTYQPIVAGRWISETTIRAERAFNVRQRVDQVMKPGGVADADIAKCTKYTA
ncbi:TadE/TadG family type IV pilus assembly protein [Sphingomonas solaris]|nr:TadE/TadG family type IV pilus assembly protein [Sphingomonas solaris]